jgi:hypothetical protein
MKHIAIATEDAISEAIAEKLVAQYSHFSIHQKLGKKGNGYLKASLSNFFEMAKQHPVFMLVDLDLSACAPKLIEQWQERTNKPKPVNMLLRIVVREIESWLMADYENFNRFLCNAKIPRDVEALQNPKQTLLNLAKKSPTTIKKALLPAKNNLAIQGLEYNSCLCGFVRETWNPETARANSDSLNRACERLIELSNRMRQ